MDIALIRTFLAVSDTGSFAAAAGRLFVTQSAVSLRVQRLEDVLGQTLFNRSKAGVTLTTAGKGFEPYAISLLKLWEEARQQVAVPEGFSRTLSVGAQYSLWPRLGFRWFDALRAAHPDVALRGELGMPDRLTRFLVEGVIQVALTYMPQHRPGLSVYPVMDDELVLVSSIEGIGLDDIGDRYVFMDWGPEFSRAHESDLSGLGASGIKLSLGAMGLDYILNRDAAAYLPARTVAGHLETGRLHLVPGAPVFPYPVWLVMRDDLPAELRDAAQHTLTQVAATQDAAQSAVLDDLASLTDGGSVTTFSDVTQTD